MSRILALLFHFYMFYHDNQGWSDCVVMKLELYVGNGK